MDEYIASPDYKTDGAHKGICMGFQQFNDTGAANNYTFAINFPDMKIGLSGIGYA